MPSSILRHSTAQTSQWKQSYASSFPCCFHWKALTPTPFPVDPFVVWAELFLQLLQQIVRQLLRHLLQHLPPRQHSRGTLRPLAEGGGLLLA
jgi:hypothetical protein